MKVMRAWLSMVCVMAACLSACGGVVDDPNGGPAESAAPTETSLTCIAEIGGGYELDGGACPADAAAGSSCEVRLHRVDHPNGYHYTGRCQ